MPDATTLLKFRCLLIEHKLTRKLFDEIGISLCKRGLMMKEGTLVDATIIEAPPSTKNARKSRDPEMHQTKKGQRMACVTNLSASLGCCTEDGRRPSGVGLQEQTPNRPVPLRSKGVVVSDCGKVTR